MYKYSFLLVLLLAGTALLAQDEAEYKEPSKESKAYHQYRLKDVSNLYQQPKIVAIVNKIKSDEDGNTKIDAKTYQSLSLREKFTYHLINPESYNQNCDIAPPIQDEHKKIFGFLIDDYGEYSWSDRQEKFFVGNRDSVIKFITEYTDRDKHMGVELKHVLVKINAKEMIPYLIKTYNINKKDHDILTLLMILMRDNQYLPFMESQSYKKLYGDEYNYGNFLVFNSANEALIIQRATDFYNGLNK